MSEPVTIRGAQSHDIAALVGFNQAMALETEDRVLGPQTLEPGVSAVLTTPRLGFYLVAEKQAQAGPTIVAGALMVTFEWSDWRNANFWWVQSVFVRPEFRGTGIYRALYERVRQDAAHRGDVCGIRLYVEKDNVSAQEVYEKLGMSPTHYLMYEEEFH